MPAMLDDPDAATIYRVSGEPPYPEPGHPSIPASIKPRQVTLRDRQTVATVVPFASRHQVPESLLRYLNDQFNKEIDGGDTYPMMEGLPFDKFASYWFQNFGAIMLLGDIASADEVVDGKDWSKECLGTFYIKPNYPGRSSHVCNAGFIVTDASRNRGVGRLMGESYLDWAPKLGYTYSVFNLVYETNVASCKIWDALGFKRIGRVREAGNLKSFPGRLVDAIIYGRELGQDGTPGENEPVSEERFDKIEFYLKYGRYPTGADRAEKSRLRSAATHYKLVDGVLMLKDKEVISHPKRQYDIARRYHNAAHAGINKTTATIAERYHWSRIKETVSDVIRNCPECKELGKTSSPAPVSSVNNQANPTRTGRSAGKCNSLAPSSVFSSKRKSRSPSASASRNMASATQPGPWGMPLPESVSMPEYSSISLHQSPSPAVMTPSHTFQANVDQQQHTDNIPMLQDEPHDTTFRHNQHHQHQHTAISALEAIPNTQHSHTSHVSVYHPIDPQIINQPSPTHMHTHPPHHDDFHAYSFQTHDHDHDHDHDQTDTQTFEALLHEAELSHDHQHHPPHGDLEQDHHRRSREEEEAVDRDLEMLIQQPVDDYEDEYGGEGREGRGDRAGTSMDTGMEVDGSLDNGDVGTGDGLDGIRDTGEGRRASVMGKMDFRHLLSAQGDEDGEALMDGTRMGDGEERFGEK